MRTPLAISGCLALLCVGWCFGQAQTATHPPGGGDWKALPPSDRALYLSGFLQGYKLGIVHAGVLAISKLSPEKVSTMTPAEKKEYDESLEWAHKAAPLLLHGGPSRLGLESTVSTFYADYRNMPVCFEDAVLFSAASLAGNAATDQELKAAREKGAESGCR